MNKQSSLTHKQIWTVAKWEFLHFFKLKQEIISKLIMLLIAVIIYFFAANGTDLSKQYSLATNTKQQLFDQLNPRFKFKYVEDKT